MYRRGNKTVTIRRWDEPGTAGAVCGTHEGRRPMKLLTAGIALLILASACGTSQPGKPDPTVLGTQAPGVPGQATEDPIPHY